MKIFLRAFAATTMLVPVAAISQTVAPVPTIAGIGGYKVPASYLAAALGGTVPVTRAAGDDSRITGAIPNTHFASPRTLEPLAMPGWSPVTDNNTCEWGDSQTANSNYGPRQVDAANQNATEYGRRQDGYQTWIGRYTGIFFALAGNQGIAGDTTQASPPGVGTHPGTLTRMQAMMTTTSLQLAPCWHAKYAFLAGGTNDITSWLSASDTTLTPQVTLANRETMTTLAEANGSIVFEIPILPRNIWNAAYTVGQIEQADNARRWINAQLRIFCSLEPKCLWWPVDGVESGNQTIGPLTAGTQSGKTLPVIGTTLPTGNVYRGWSIHTSSGTVRNIAAASGTTSLTLQSATPVISGTFYLAQNSAAIVAMFNGADGLHEDGNGAGTRVSELLSLYPTYFHPTYFPGEVTMPNTYSAKQSAYRSVLMNGGMLGTNGTVTSPVTGTAPGNWKINENGTTSMGTDVGSMDTMGVPGGGNALVRTISRTAAGGKAEQYVVSQNITNDYPMGSDLYAKCMVKFDSGNSSLFTDQLEMAFDSGHQSNDGPTSYAGSPQIPASAFGRWLYFETPIFTTTTTGRLAINFVVHLITTSASSGSPVAITYELANCGVYQAPVGALM